MRKQMRLGLAGLGLGWMAVSYAEPVTLVRETVLRAEPALFAATVATDAKGVTGESIGKSGIWVHVKTPDQSGWVFTFNLRHGGPRTGATGASSAQAAGRFVSARPRTQVVSTIGIRGLSEEDLQNATFNRAQMERLKSLSASAQDGEQHARALGLEPALQSMVADVGSPCPAAPRALTSPPSARTQPRESLRSKSPQATSAAGPEIDGGQYLREIVGH